jgi:type VI secretion system protein ImpK
MGRSIEVTRDCFDAILALREADDASLPDPAQLHAGLRGVVDELLRRAAAAGFGRDDVQDMTYAVVALLDEVVLGKGSEGLRQFWSGQPLQIHYFQENVAGEAFFARLEAVRRDPQRLEVLRVYHLALLFGFQGRYRVRGGEFELLGLTDALDRDLARAEASDTDELSPRGARPAEGAGRSARGGPMLWMGLGALALSLVLYVGLRISLSTSTAAVVERLATTAAR